MGEVWDADQAPEQVKKHANWKDRSKRARVAQWIKFRAEEPGISNKEVAKRLGISPTYLSNIIYEASKAGWLRFQDPLLELEHKLIPKIVRNLDEMLDARSEKITIEAAKGTLFPIYKESKGISDAPQMAIALRMELPIEGQIVTGTVLGAPKGLPPVLDEM